MLFLRACCAVAEGADVPLSLAVAAPIAPLHASPAVCVRAVLGDALRRVAVLGGREGMPRSLGSVYGGSVTRFLGGSYRGVVSRVIDSRGVKSDCNGMAVSRDGCTLLVADCWGASSDGVGNLRVVLGHGVDVGVRAHATRSTQERHADEAVEVEARRQHLHAVVAPVHDEHEAVGVDPHLLRTAELQRSGAPAANDTASRAVRRRDLVESVGAAPGV